MDPVLVAQLHRLVCQQPQSACEESDAAVEVKRRSNWQSEYDIPELEREVLRFVTSGLFLGELSRLTGIPKLIADPYCTGGGFNLSGKGDYLDVHVDGNWHDDMAVHCLQDLQRPFRLGLPHQHRPRKSGQTPRRGERDFLRARG